MDVEAPVIAAREALLVNSSRVMPFERERQYQRSHQDTYLQRLRLLSPTASAAIARPSRRRTFIYPASSDTRQSVKVSNV